MRSRTKNKKCPTGKSPYRSFKQMKKVIAKAYKERQMELYPYRCGDCGQWHVSSMSKEDFNRQHLSFRGIK